MRNKDDTNLLALGTVIIAFIAAIAVLVLIMSFAGCVSYAKSEAGAVKMKHTVSTEKKPVTRTTRVLERSTPEDAPVQQKEVEEVVVPGETRTEVVEGEATGGVNIAAGEKVDSHGQAAPPQLILPGVEGGASTGSGFGGGIAWETKITTRNGLLMLLAMVGIAAGAYVGLFARPVPNPRLGLFIAVGGVLAACAAMFEPVELVLYGLGAVGVLWWVQRDRRAAKVETLAGKFVRAVSKLPDEAKTAVKREISGLTNADDERLIGELKAKEDV